jgi:hypothetical protein
MKFFTGLLVCISALAQSKTPITHEKVWNNEARRSAGAESGGRWYR